MSRFKTKPHGARIEVGHMPGSGILRVTCAIAAVLLTSSCSSGTSSDAARSRLTDTLNQLATQTNNYNTHTKEEYPANPSQFLKDATQDLAAIHASAGDWNTAAAKAHLGPTPQDGWPSQAEVASFATALDNWIAAQEEQVNAIRSCMNTVDQATCLQAATSQNSGGWLDAQSHLVIAYQSMTKGTKMGASGAPPTS